MTQALEKSKLKGFDVIIDSLSGDFFLPGYQSLKTGGRVITIGSATLMPNSGLNIFQWISLGLKFWKRPTLDLFQLMSEGKGVVGCNLSWIFDNHSEFGELLDQLRALDLQPPIVGKTFEFEQIKEALAFFQSGKNVGKIVIVNNK